MASTDRVSVKKDYNENATTYSTYFTTPTGILETQLLDIALGDCTNLTILDIGGGTGHRARQALDHGASHVDIIDISSCMLQTGQKLESDPNHHHRLSWIEADCSKPLPSNLQLQKSYDIVMANWIFDHAGTIEELEGMWRNIALYLKPGGRFIGCRGGDPKAPGVVEGKYGVKWRDVEEIPGGFRYRYEVVDAEPPVDIEATVMEVSFSGSVEMHERFGLYEVEVVPYHDAEVVRKNETFWGEFLKMPHFAVVTGRKKIV